MKMYNLLFAMLLAFSLISCKDEDTQGPNEMGGDGNIKQNNVGNTWQLYPEINEIGVAGLDGIKNTVEIINNDNGNLTIKAKIIFNESHFHIVDSLIGIKGLPDETKKSVLDTYKADFDFTIDTSDKQNMVFEKTIKAKITSDGIQDYVISKGDLSKPFTLVKYNDNVGAKYEFTDSKGRKIIRTIISKDTVETYQVAFWTIKVTKVEEIKEDPLVSKITYYTNHKFGLVNIAVELKNGKFFNIAMNPPNPF